MKNNNGDDGSDGDGVCKCHFICQVALGDLPNSVLGSNKTGIIIPASIKIKIQLKIVMPFKNLMVNTLVK